MTFLYFDAFAGASGDMILGALLDLGVSQEKFTRAMAGLGLPVAVSIKEVKRSTLRALKVDVDVTAGKSPKRTRKDVEEIISGSSFSGNVKKKASEVFQTLFAAEARAHGRRPEKTHLHEAGADDALVDILGTCYLLETLGVEAVYSSPLNVGRGWTKSSHGVLPVPPPAVAEILKGIPVYSAQAEQELVTPTGAAILATLADKFFPLPELCYQRVGCGAGSRDLPQLPNILRVLYGKTENHRIDRDVHLIETNLDDVNPQVLAGFFEKALELGALDVHLTPVVMKKNRLGTQLTVLAEKKNMEELISAIFEETTSLGVRYFPVGRRILQRRIETVKIHGGTVSVKVASFGGKDINVKPEFDECQKLARKKKIPVKKILAEVLEEFNRKKQI